MAELSAAHAIHKEHGTHLGGVHLELTGVRPSPHLLILLN